MPDAYSYNARNNLNLSFLYGLGSNPRPFKTKLKNMKQKKHPYLKQIRKTLIAMTANIKCAKITSA